MRGATIESFPARSGSKIDVYHLWNATVYAMAVKNTIAPANYHKSSTGTTDQLKLDWWALLNTETQSTNR